MLKLCRGWAALVLLLGLGAGAMAQVKDVKGSSDHPIVSRYAGSVLVGHGLQQHEQINAPLGPVQERAHGQAVKELKAEGRLHHYLYWAPAQRSSLEVLRNYEKALKDKGFSILYVCDEPVRCLEQGLGRYSAKWTQASSTFSGGATAPARMDDSTVYPPRYLVAQRESGGNTVYVTLTAREASSTEKDKQMGGPYYLQVLEAQSMQVNAVEVLNARQIGGALAQTGKAIFYGIQFDTDSASIQPGSQGQLRSMIEVLKSQPKLRVFIVGHTDNVGAYEHNQSLSLRRAQSLVDALAKAGIEKTRLQAAGVANVSPLASNADAAGRAKNRRVEMVLQ